MKLQVFIFLTATIIILASMLKMENSILWYIMCNVSGSKNYEILFLFPQIFLSR